MMDSRIGLDLIVENSDYIHKFSNALDTNNETVKKQVIELLSALCAYSQLGYNRAMETLDLYKNLKKKRYRLTILVTELDHSKSLDYKVTLLTFLNCLIISSKNADSRMRIRSELISLGLMPVINNLRRTAITVPDLKVQLKVFDEHKECDEESIARGPDGINLSSHLDVFYAVLQQVVDTPQEISFLNILQHLLRIDSKEAISDTIWNTAETLIHRAALIENKDDSERLIRTPNLHKITCPHCKFDISSPRKLSIPQNNLPVTALSTPQGFQSGILSQQPLVSFSLPNESIVCNAPPPPPLPPALSSHKNVSQNIPVPPVFPSATNYKNQKTECSHRAKSPEAQTKPLKQLPQQEIPTPRAKMKTINWNKIHPSKVIGKNNIWSEVANNHQNNPMIKLNWDEMEGLFCQQITQCSPKLGKETVKADTVENRRSRRDEIILLDGKRSLNINIFLKQFRSTNLEITRMIVNGEHEIIGLEKLRGLLKILPEIDELEMLKNFNGDKERLGNAEKFLTQLIHIPNYRLRIDCMLLKEEFTANMSYLTPSINSMLCAGNDLITSKALQEVLYMVVLVGNFLNAGGYAGNAAGVKLSSLQKLADIRANKPGMNLIHFVALQAENNKELLSFANQMNDLENASKMTIEQLNNEISALVMRIGKVKANTNLPSTEEDIKLQMQEFLKDAEKEIMMLQRAMNDLEKMRVHLADFFCEDESQFKIEECFKIFYHFCEKFKTAIKDNEKRRIQEEQANLRRKQREEQLANKRRQFSQYVPPVSNCEQNIFMDPPTISYDIRFSPAMNRRRIGSFNNNINSTDRDDCNSPDITPNGSLRRRRSRVLSEEEEGNLMDFLRSSGHDGSSRERKSALTGYGSLDRSWARRARSGNAKTRPELLNVDFGAERERSVSPAVEPKLEVQVPEPDVKPRGISREWRQKIESWLQANEQDEKHNDEYRKKMRRVQTRRSLETDIESDKGNKLDTLLEEKSQNHAIPNSTLAAKDSSFESYQRVYPEWKPSTTLETTDIVGTIEAIAGMAYVQAHSRDKSVLRKSVLNSAENMSAENVSLGCRRQNSRDGNIPILQSITEEDKKKKSSVYEENYLSGANKEFLLNADDKGEKQEINKQSIYIKPKDEELISIRSPRDTSKHNSSVYICPETDVVKPKSSKKNLETLNSKETNNKVDIDNENIETPPTVRKNFVHKQNKTNESPPKIEPENLGDGQFDRFADSRRTRRFKRSTDQGNNNFQEGATTISSDTSINQHELSSSKKNTVQKSKDMNDEIKSNVISRIGKIGKSISRISQEDVREAIRSLKSPTPERERDWRDSFRVTTSANGKLLPHELNDEGFEETQSLVSDTPSLTASSCNEEAKLKKESSSDTKINKIQVIANKKSIRPSIQLQTLLSRNQQSLERSRSLRSAPPVPSRSLAAPTPQRTMSLRKHDTVQLSLSTASAKKRLDVEKSSSRTSLGSSRTSLSSSISTNTVKKMPVKSNNVTPSSSLVKRTTTVSSSGTKAPFTTRVPASRSSSSGSSIGPSNLLKLTSIHGPNITIKEISNVQSKNSSTSSTKTNDSAIRPSSRVATSSFMRPTTATNVKARQKLK